MPAAEVTDAPSDDLVDAAQAALDLVGRDPHQALDAADAVIARLPRPRRPRELQAAALADRAAGLALRELGRLDDAEQRLRRACRVGDRCGDPSLAALCRMSLGYLLLDLGRPGQSLRMLRDDAPGLPPDVRARVSVIRALALQRSGRIAEALAEYGRALAGLRGTDHSDWVARLRNNRGLLLAYLGRTDDARADLEEARRLYLLNGLSLMAADVLWNIGWVVGMAGDVPGALRLMAERDADPAAVERPECAIDRAQLLLGVGLAEEAHGSLAGTVPRLSAMGWSSLEAEARLLLALSAPTPDEAVAQGALARRMLEQQHRHEWVLLARFVVMSTRVHTSGTTLRTQEIVRLIDELQTAGWTAHAARLAAAVGDRRLERGDAVRACQVLETLRPTRHDADPQERAARTLAAALLARAGGDDSAALRLLDRGWREVDERIASLGATELRISAAAAAEPFVRWGVRIELERSRLGRVLAWSERGRSAALRHHPLRPPADPALGSALTALRWATSAADRARLDGQPDRVAERQAREAARRVTSLMRVARAYGTGVPPASLAEVRRHLPPDADFLHLYVSDGLLRAIRVDARGGEENALCRIGDLQRLMEDARFGLRRLAAGSGSSRGLASLRARQTGTIARLETMLRCERLLRPDARTLIVSPASDLVDVPWHLMPACSGRDVSVVPSASVWVRAVSALPRGGAATSLAGPGLPRAAWEADAVARTHGGRAITNGAATVGAAVDALSSSRIVHLAAHATTRTDHPMLSTITLADGDLFLYELEALPRLPEIVVLAACGTAATHPSPSGQGIGFAWALMALGVRSVVAPVYPVTDDSTASVMEELHLELARGSGPAAALRLARERAGEPGAPEVFVACGA